MIFQYDRRACEHLAGRDAALGAWIERLGKIEREVIPDPFAALVNSIAGQQVSSKAQRTIWERLCVRGLTTPEAILSADEQALRQTGLGGKKTLWIRQAAARAAELADLAALSDEEVVARLTTFAGVGRWTAQMLLIFSLNRMDVFSRGDFGIRKGLALLHGEQAVRDFSLWRARYAPYGSVASLYLWEIARVGEGNADI